MTPSKLFRIPNHLLGRKKDSLLPCLPSGIEINVAKMFSEFFIEKVTKIRDSIPPAHEILDLSPTCVTAHFAVFQQVSAQDKANVIKNCASKSRDLDPMPTSLVKMPFPQLGPLITSITEHRGIPT